MTALTLLWCVVLCTIWTPARGFTSVLAWDAQVCGQTTCSLGASVRSTLVNDASENVILRHPSRSDVVIDLNIRPQFKQIDLFFKFQRNFSNLYEHHSEGLNCMYSNDESPESLCQSAQSLCCLTQTDRAPGQYCLLADASQSYAAYYISDIAFTAALELNVTVTTANTSSNAVVQLSSTSSSVEHSALSAQLFTYESVPVSSLATIAQTLLLFVSRDSARDPARDSARDWFVVDNSSTIFPRLSLSSEEWQRQVSCVQPQHYLSATQSIAPRDQYYALQDQTWELYYTAVDSNSAVTVRDTLFRSMQLNYTASANYQLTMLIYYD